MAIILYYIHDPMCSWCWGYRPVWQALQQNLPDVIQVKYVAGGLAPDTDKPMPSEQQNMIEAHWHTIQKKLGTAFNFDFWRLNTPRRSTYNACRAVIAANNQGYQSAMIEAIQKAYYLQALNPSDKDVLVGLATNLAQQSLAEIISNQAKISQQTPVEVVIEKTIKSPLLAFDLSRFTRDLISTETQQALMTQINLARELTHQGFPSLVLDCGGERQQIPIHYQAFKPSLMAINSALVS